MLRTLERLIRNLPTALNIDTESKDFEDEDEEDDFNGVDDSFTLDHSVCVLSCEVILQRQQRDSLLYPVTECSKRREII